MSAGSFDDSSNLVDVASHSNGEQKADKATVDTSVKDKKDKSADLLDEPADVDEAKEADAKPKSKKSKAKKLFKRAKSPISGAINKTTKEFKKLSNLPKHHYSVPKSPQKSPSKENLTEEYKHLEEKISEKSKASEEWLAFQQMQDRIKQTVLKTQNSLHKYSSHSEDEDSKLSKWTAFDEETEEAIDTTLRTGPAINVSCVNQEIDDGQLLDLDITQGKAKAPSPPTAPGPPVNSRISSMDNLMEKMDDANPPQTNDSLDFLGLGDDSTSNVTSTAPVSSNLMQDMLGLDSCLEPTPLASMADQGDEMGADVLSGYTFSTSGVNESAMDVSASEAPKSDMNDILMFEQPMTSEQISGMMSKPPKPDQNISDINNQNASTAFTSLPKSEAPFQIDSDSVDSTPVQPALDSEPLQPSIAATQIQPAQDTAAFQATFDATPLEPTLESVPLQPTFDSAPLQPTFDSTPLQPTFDPTPLQPTVDATTSDSAPMQPTFDSTLSQPTLDATPLQPTFDSAPMQPTFDSTPLQPVPASHSITATSSDSQAVDMALNSTLEPAAFSLSADQVVPDSNTEASLALDDLDTFDPMKSGIQEMPKAQVAPQSTFNPFQTVTDNQGFGTPLQTYGAVPIEHDIMSKIRKMSSSSQPISPARKLVSKPSDPFGFVKKELGADEDDGTYKSMADLQKKKEKESEVVIPDEQITDQSVSNENNPFLSGDFDDDFSNKEVMSENAAAMFGVEPDSFLPETSTAPTGDLDGFLGGTEENKEQRAWTDVSAMDDTSMWEDTTDASGIAGTDTVWDTTADTSKPGDAWGSEQAGESTDGLSNPFQQDDFSKLDDIPFAEQKEAVANPFFAGPAIDLSAAAAASANPFLNLDDQPMVPEQSDDLLGGSKSMMLSDSESFFLDSVNDNQQSTVESDDIFDPFKVTKKEPTEVTSGQDNSSEPLDVFSAVAASGDKQLAKPSDDDHGFMLEIKPVTGDATDKSNAIPAPILKPPPKPPKSPQPPRVNPFDKESPPEENFAQFEVKEIEKPKEPPTKSLSTDSYTTEEEPEQPLEPLEPFLPKIEKEGFKLMLRYPTKKKIAGNRYWKNVIVKIQKQSEGPMLKVFNDGKDNHAMEELLLQACYSLSDICLQQYDQYGKIHAVKMQYVFYKERVGIKTERIAPSIVKFKKREKPKATMILDHSPQVSELLKFGSLDKGEILLFMQAIEDTLMNLDAHREKTLTYTKDEITAEVRDEYMAELDKFGKVLMQKARVRIFVLAFLTGMPTVECGLNDKRRRGKEVVGRCDIIPIKTEEWIKLEDVEFHTCVDKEDFEKTNNIKFIPLDACQFELLRYRVRLRENKELPLQLTIQQIFKEKERKCEIRCDLLVTGYHSYSKKHGQFPCEDIEVRFPIPEQWIYMFRYERRFGYGSIHSSLRKPGKIKGLERLTMMAQGLSQSLMEADVGTAKYEHVYRAVVWRIPRLPVRNQGAYTSHLFKLKLELGPHDEIPDSFETSTHVEFTMPCSTVSQSQIRSIAVTNPNPPEKWVRSMGKYIYKIEIEHLDEYPEFMAVGTVYKEAASTNVKSDEENEPEERDPRLAVSDSDSSDTD